MNFCCMQYEDSQSAGKDFQDTTGEVKIKNRNHLGVH